MSILKYNEYRENGEDLALGTAKKLDGIICELLAIHTAVAYASIEELPMWHYEAHKVFVRWMDLGRIPGVGERIP